MCNKNEVQAQKPSKEESLQSNPLESRKFSPPLEIVETFTKKNLKDDKSSDS